MSIEAEEARLSRRPRSWRSALAAFIRAEFSASGTGLSLDAEDLIYADGFAAGERGEPWAPTNVDARRREIWTEGYRDGRRGGSGARRRRTSRFFGASPA